MTLNDDLINKLFAQAAAGFEKQSREYEKKQQAQALALNKAKAGDIPAILELKKLAKAGDTEAKAVLEKLYYDGNKEHAVGTVVLREGITEVEESAFKECKNLEEIVLPDSLTGIGGIGGWAFSGCSGLRKIYIPDNDTAFVGLGAFYDCDGSVKILGSKFLDSIGVKTLADYRRLDKITLPDGLTEIGDYAFSFCSGLREIHLPDGLTKISEGAFSGCSGLTEIRLPDGVTEIGSSAFRGCRGLTEIHLPDSVTEIGGGAFFGCSGLKDLPDSVTEIGFWVFEKNGNR